MHTIVSTEGRHSKSNTFSMVGFRWGYVIHKELTFKQATTNPNTKKASMIRQFFFKCTMNGYFIRKGRLHPIKLVGEISPYHSFSKGIGAFVKIISFFFQDVAEQSGNTRQ